MLQLPLLVQGTFVPDETRRSWAEGGGGGVHKSRWLPLGPRRRSTGTMALRLEPWLWLWLLVQVASLPYQPQPGEASYQLVSRPQDFPAAQAWCWWQGGSLLRSWGPRSKGFLQHNLERGSKSWIAPSAEVPQAQGEDRGGGE